MSRRDEELILYFYGEHESPAEVERALAADPELARRYEDLRRDLSGLDALPAAVPRPGIEARMWARVAAELAPRRRAILWRWAAVAALAVLVLGAFVAGRWLEPAPDEAAVVATLKGFSPEARDRVLQAALADHLESSQRLLLEVANGDRLFDEERASAARLLSANSLYRRAAQRAGERRVAAVLLELEEVLTDLANASASSGPRLPQARAKSEELLFKVRVTRNNLKGFS